MRRILGGRYSPDVASGALLFGVGAFVLWDTRHLSSMIGFTFGAGTAPRLVAWLLCATGALIAIRGIASSRTEHTREPFRLKSLTFVFASVAFFSWSIDAVGFVCAVFGTVLLAACASPEFRWRESVTVAALATVASALLFVVLLKLPVPLWPWE